MMDCPIHEERDGKLTHLYGRRVTISGDHERASAVASITASTARLSTARLKDATEHDIREELAESARNVKRAAYLELELLRWISDGDVKLMRKED